MGQNRAERLAPFTINAIIANAALESRKSQGSTTVGTLAYIQRSNSAQSRGHTSLSVQRLRTLQQKKEAQAKAARRDIATLLERGKLETARVKVESIIHEDVHIELLELLELYCELLLARFGLLEQLTREPDPGISEGVNAIIHAAPRTELKELHVLRDILMHKYGREYSIAVMENRDSCVTERVMRKLSTDTPSSELVVAYVTEIAKAYGVPWTPSAPANPDQVQASTSEDSPKPAEGKVNADEKSTPLPSDPATKLPDLPPTEGSKPASPAPPSAGGAATTTSNATAAPEGGDDFEALAKRFAALKKR